MKKGDKVMIYEDPVTRLKPEGKATLVELTEDLGIIGEFWEVRFPGDKHCYTRFIIPPGEGEQYD